MVIITFDLVMISMMYYYFLYICFDIFFPNSFPILSFDFSNLIMFLGPFILIFLWQETPSAQTCPKAQGSKGVSAWIVGYLGAWGEMGNSAQCIFSHLATSVKLVLRDDVAKFFVSPTLVFLFVFILFFFLSFPWYISTFFCSLCQIHISDVS